MRRGLGPDTKDSTCKQDFRNGTFVTLICKYFSKPLHMLNNRIDKIVCFDQTCLLYNQYLCVWLGHKNIMGRFGVQVFIILYQPHILVN